MDLQLASLRQVDDVDTVVVQVLHAAVEVLPQESAGFAGQRDASEAQLQPGENGGEGETESLHSRYPLWEAKLWCVFVLSNGTFNVKHDFSFIDANKDSAHFISWPLE